MNSTLRNDLAFYWV